MDPYYIGAWMPFEYEEFKKTFKHISPGDFKTNLIKKSHNFSLLMTDEGIKTMTYVDGSFRAPKIFELEILKEHYKKVNIFILMF